MRYILCIFLLVSGPALAAPADVVGATVSKSGDGTYSFDVTVRSDDTGWDKYADRWEVVAPDGTVLGRRDLLHPHEDEQPFTRSLSGVTVPQGVGHVTIRAHDKVEGFGGAELKVTLP
jgi:hypothetical protein